MQLQALMLNIYNFAQVAEQELELPEDMALDGDGMADADEANEGGPNAPEAEADAPETFPEQRDAGADDGDGAEQADQDADMADQADAQDGVHTHSLRLSTVLRKPHGVDSTLLIKL